MNNNIFFVIYFLLNMIVLHAADNKNTRPRSASTDYAFTSKKSPERFKNPELRQEAKNFQDAEKLEKYLGWVLKQPSSSTSSKGTQFNLSLFLLARYNSIDAEALDEDRKLFFQKKIHELGADYYYNLGLYQEEKAREHFKNYQRHSPRSKSPHQLLQKAIRRCNKAQSAMRDAYAMEQNTLIEEKLQGINSLCLTLNHRLQSTSEYKQGIVSAKNAYKKQQTGNNSLSRSQAKMRKADYFQLLYEAKNNLLGAAEDYLNSAQIFLDKTQLRAVEKNLDRIQDIERQIYEANPNAYETEPRIKKIEEMLEPLKEKLKEQEKGISSVEDSLEFPIDHEKRK